MSEDGYRPRSRRRNLTADEHALWKAATRAVRPMGRRRRVAEGPTPAAASESEDTAGSAAPLPQRSVAPQPVRRAAPPPLAPLTRRMTQRVARGRAAIDARIDLHGLTQDRAHGALLHFLRRAQADAAKLVLVITGKGARGGVTGEPGRGVLHGAVPRWLELPDFRPYVVGFERAHVAHGGDGALYVQIRRGRG
jgi:DNA-nicking Smr family endonuclease